MRLSREDKQFLIPVAAVSVVLLLLSVLVFETARIAAACTFRSPTGGGSCAAIAWIPAPLYGGMSLATLLILVEFVRRIVSRARQCLQATSRLEDELRSLEVDMKLDKSSLSADAALMLMRSPDVTVSAHPRLFACTLGFLRPRIYASCHVLWGLPADQARAVLAHEAEHCRRWDPLRVAILEVASAAEAFVPCLTSQIHRARVDMEIRADRAAVDCAGRRSLLEAMMSSLSWSRSSVGGALFVGELSAARRIRAVLGDEEVHEPVTRPRVSSVAFVLALLGALLMVTMGTGYSESAL